LFILADSAAAPAGGPIRPHKSDYRPPIGIPSDIVGVSSQGLTWFLDPERGRVTGQDVGGNRVVIADLRVRGTVRTACALGEHAIAFLDAARPGQVFVHDLTEPFTTRTMSFPAGFVDEHSVRWTDLRFGGSPEGPCVLWAPHMHSVIVVSDSSVQPLGPFVEPLSATERDEQERGAWHRWLTYWFTRAAPPPVGALDATSVPGGVAVLFAGRTPYAGRLVDFYTETGQFLETMRLPFRARRIAGTRHRLLVLSARGDSVYVASYILPAKVRLLPTADEPPVIPPLDPVSRGEGRGGDVPPGDARPRSP
jgi:hypothetical protein